MRRLAAISTVVAFLGLPSVAAAQAVPGGLNGEGFIGSESFFVTERQGLAQDCDQNGTSTVRFRAFGPATGPYPGTFTETGTLTIGPQTLDQPSVAGTAQAGPVLTFTANFTIESGTTTVTGTKTLSATLNGQPYESTGACASFENSTKLGVFDPAFFVTISGRSYRADVSSTYEATISTAGGTIQDTGYASTSFLETYLTGGTCVPISPALTCEVAGRAGGSLFREHFVSVAEEEPPSPSPQCSDTLDNDNDGKTDFPADPGCEAATDDSESPDPAPVPATLTLAPKAATNDVGTGHCVTATVKDASGDPVSGVTVRFSVTGASNTSGTATTNNDGQAEFCYQGPDFPGTDAIKAHADTNKDGSQDVGEPFDTATKAFVLPQSTPLCTVTITKGGRIRAANGDKATFGGNAKVSSGGSPTGQEEYTDHGPAQPLKVKSIKILAVICSQDRKQATIYGSATVNGSGSHLFRIQVTDNGEPGTNDTYGILLSTGYYSGEQKLQGGNIQIR